MVAKKRLNVKPSAPCPNCGRDLWISGNRTSVLGLCWHCVVPVMDVQGDLNDIMTLEDDEDPARPSCWYPAIDGTGQGYLF